MRLLIVTQVVDTKDPVLGFFVRWIEEFAKYVEQIEVICLKEGVHELPVNVHVHSLGKERGTRNRITYTLRFLSLAWSLRYEYDAAFVHMNQEYVLIAGWFWKLLGKRIYMWRNHYAGSWFTDIAAVFCAKIFCTSQYSYTAKYKRTVRMPVGVDTERFSPDVRVTRMPHSILFLGRISPSKRPEVLVNALALLVQEGVESVVSFVGSPLAQDEVFYEMLKEHVHALGLSDRVSFHLGVPNNQTPDLYRSHEIFVNASRSGMLDKTIFEAMACGASILVSNKDLRERIDPEFIFTEGSSEDLAQHLKHMLLLSEAERIAKNLPFITLVSEQCLEKLGNMLIAELRV